MTLYDLSQPIESGMCVYPGSRPVTVEEAATVDADSARVTELTFDAHVGTHVDAPAHTLADGETLAAYDLSAFTFEARLVDCTHAGARESIGPGDLRPKDDPAPADHDLLVVRTGWDEHWGTDRYRDHPYLSEAAAEWCADRDYSVGLDTFGPDPTPSADPDREPGGESDGYPAHDAVFAAGGLVVENLRGLDRLPAEFTLTAPPLSLAAEASPVRAVARSEE